MFDQEAAKAASIGPGEVPKEPEIDLKGLSVPVLMRLRAKIDAALPSVNLGDVNLAEEMLRQYHLTKAIMLAVEEDKEVPTNQKAQVINSCTAQLKELSKLQIDLYNAERVKGIESALERAFKGVPEHIKEAFYIKYSQFLSEMQQKQEESA